MVLLLLMLVLVLLVLVSLEEGDGRGRGGLVSLVMTTVYWCGLLAGCFGHACVNRLFGVLVGA